MGARTMDRRERACGRISMGGEGIGIEIDVAAEVKGCGEGFFF
jgi:hypothetical protein